MNTFVLLLALACFLYGAYALAAGRLLRKDLEQIAPRHRRLYARLCGVVLLLEAAVLGTLYDLLRTDRLRELVREPLLLMLFFAFAIVPLLLHILTKSMLRNKQ